ncbi:MAG: hypothetical protein E7413_00990 [Ruminococcaceae bacterium]|nr:hypothetical protein [Oscillospiraceae bacterium]
MTAATQPLNIYQKLAKIRKPVEVIQKNKKGFGYMYVTEDVILSKITGLMDKHGVSLIPNIIKDSTEVMPYSYTKTKTTQAGKIYDEHVNEIIIKADMEWHWVNNDNPEDRVVVPWALVGQQNDASQAFGSGLSYSSRYFMLKYFNVATSDDDPDKWRSEQKEAQLIEEREIALKIVEEIHSIVISYIEANPDKKPEVTELIKQYARGKNGKPTGDYYCIENPVVASELLNAIKEKLLNIKEK